MSVIAVDAVLIYMAEGHMMSYDDQALSITACWVALLKLVMQVLARVVSLAVNRQVSCVVLLIGKFRDQN